MNIIFALSFCLAAAPGAGMPPPVIGVVFQSPEQVNSTHWTLFSELSPLVEILAMPEGNSPQLPFDFTACDEVLNLLSSKGLSASATLLPHLRTVPWIAQVDENGKEYTDRQNPFDPAFLAEWRRSEDAFVAHYKNDARLRRIYVTPPSYFGESEYYMGPDWWNLKFLAYSPLARDRFMEWLTATYKDPAALGKAWNADIASWEAVQLPKPNRTSNEIQTSCDWLDFMTWRMEYLDGLLADHIRAVSAGYTGEVAMKFSVATYSAGQGTLPSAIASRCRDLPNLVFHMTNGHSLSDMMHTAGMVSLYNAKTWTTENDGNRYNRAEIARVTLNCLLTGCDTFNFSHFGHLTGGVMPDPGPTDSAKALITAKVLLDRYNIPALYRNPAIFLHSSVTRYIRAPKFRNRDVSHVYDQALANCGETDARAYDWGRPLGLPGVADEQMVLDGVLEGRRLAIIPNTGVTAWPTAVRATILEWVKKGGVLVVFGADGFRNVINPPASGSPRYELAEGWGFLETTPSESPMRLTEAGSILLAGSTWEPGSSSCPVWLGPLPAGWTPLLVDAAGGIAAAQLHSGAGKAILWAGAVPEEMNGVYDNHYRQSVPAFLAALSGNISAPPAFRLLGPDGRAISSALALGYVGILPDSGRHLFVGGAYDGSARTVTFETGKNISGEGVLVLPDSDRVDVRAADSQTVFKMEEQPSSQAGWYMDPVYMDSAQGRSFPRTIISFTAPAKLTLTF